MRCKLLVTIIIIFLFLAFLRWLLAVFVALRHLSSAVLFAQLVDYLGLPSTLYTHSVSCPGCNQFSAPYLIEPRQLAYCTYDRPVFLMVLVISRPDNYNRRMAMRRSWASISAHREKSIQTFFVCGRTLNSTVQLLLDGEAKWWHDVLQVNTKMIHWFY